ncbi:hypothetical protein C0J52_13579 [Blattella germanica]|nr:hypothetical protein C0J52_13579 [Blattella germanica]
MADIIIKEEGIQDHIDVVSLPDCQVTSETKVSSQIHKQMETEEEVKEEPLSNLVLPVPKNDSASVYIKQECPELSLEDTNEGIMQNETPNIEESCSSSLGSNEGESLPNECGRVESRGSEFRPLFHNNSQV